MFLAKINTIRDDLSTAEIKIADYIQKNLSQIKTITSPKLAELTGVSQTTIIRFSKKLGYNSFRELLSDISNQQTNDIISEEIKINESSEETIKKVAIQTEKILQITREINDTKTVEKAAAIIQNSDNIIIFGIGSSNLFAEYFSNQLIKMGMSCHTSHSAHTIYSLIDNAHTNSIVILISETGETKEILKAAQLAKEKKLKILAMTRNIKNSLYNFADILLKTVSFTTKTRLNVTTMRCSQLFLIDVIYILVLKEDFESKNKIISRSSKFVDNLGHQ